MSIDFGLIVEDVWREYGRNLISKRFSKQPREEVHTSSEKG